MPFLKRLVPMTASAFFFGCCAAVAGAQEPPASPAPAQAAQPTLLDREYDGQTHVMVAPYIWAPTIKGDFQFTVPTLPRRKGHGGGGLVQSSVQVGPSDYLSKLNSAAAGTFDIRKGNVDLYTDAIYVNASTTATISSIIRRWVGAWIVKPFLRK